MDIDSTSQNSDELTNSAVAKHLYSQITKMGQYDLPGLSSWGQAIGDLCGDLMLSAPRPSGGINLLTGDFIGRGLPAAVGALPVAEVFYGMTAKGFGLSDIIEELNKKLLFVLPEGLFCTACLFELDQEGKMLAVWNGGLPDLLVLDAQANIKHRVTSEHIPLGIQKMEKADLDTVFIDVAAGDKVFWCSDGAIKAKNKQGHAWGQDKIDKLLAQGSTFSEMEMAISSHIENTPQDDDITLAELDIAVIQNYDVNCLEHLAQSSLPAAQWQASFDFSADVLKHLDLVPMLVNVLMQVQAPHEHKQRIYTVLAEMCSNALEHGVLKLESSIKQSANGFAEYYELRGQRLAELSDASIKISLQHQAVGQGGQLKICVEDSGDGFDYQQYAQDLSENKALCGRGEALLRQLCDDYAVSGKGNIATATYVWAS